MCVIISCVYVIDFSFISNVIVALCCVAVFMHCGKDYLNIISTHTCECPTGSNTFTAWHGMHSVNFDTGWRRKSVCTVVGWVGGHGHFLCSSVKHSGINDHQ